ncbi:hypothetical protein QBC43DRAFT_360778 [Cladorrhinum sp. PSN259]|nr:hypothetical protein QBC43DRAFT_360778 [Cladorrhinum sp. PSN259]
MQTFTTAALVAFFSMASGHMIMNTPTPYNYKGAAGKLVQVNPLGADFPFPCQGNQDIVSVTSITAGTEQLVKFTGGAQHGGGSCQFSVTYDFPPPADPSKWKTIYTLIGGCPASAAGNLPAAQPDADGRADSPQCGNDSGTECVRQFNVPIPKDLPNGNATFAWTWYNKIGNRELYMNCAPVSITGGSSSTTFFNELPEMFVANIPGKCTTSNGVLNIPNPGKFGKVLEQPAADGEGSCPKATGIPSFGGADSGSGAGAPVVSSSSSESSTLATVTRRPVIPTSTGLVVVPIDEPTTAPAATSTSSLVAAPVDEHSTLPFPTQTLIIEPAGESCAPNDSFFCFDETHFGHCSNGRAIPQAVAPGTTCDYGVNAIKKRRFGAKFLA